MRFWLAFFAILGCALCVEAQSVITVNVKGARRQSLSLDGMQKSGAGGALFAKTLEQDLLRSSWFKLGSGGAVKVSGSVSGGPGVQESLRVAWPGKQFAWTRTADALTVRRHAHELANAIVEQVMQEKGIALSKLACVVRSGNKSDLYVCDYDGQNMKRLTNDGAAIVGPRWSTDGNYIYFTSYKRGYPAVFRTDLSGNMKQMAPFKSLNTGAVPNPVNANEIAIILSHEGNPELYVMTVSTGALKRMTRTPLAAEASPSWSPDGRKIVYVSDPAKSPQLYIVDVASRQSRLLTSRGGESVNPDWGSKGLITFATRRGAPYQVAVIDPNRGESSLRLITPKNDQYESPSWAADGRHIVAARTQGKQTSLWIIDSEENGDAPYRVLSGSGQCTNPTWSK